MSHVQGRCLCRARREWEVWKEATNVGLRRFGSMFQPHCVGTYASVLGQYKVDGAGASLIEIMCQCPLFFQKDTCALVGNRVGQLQACIFQVNSGTGDEDRSREHEGRLENDGKCSAICSLYMHYSIQPLDIQSYVCHSLSSMPQENGLTHMY